MKLAQLCELVGFGLVASGLWMLPLAVALVVVGFGLVVVAQVIQ